MIVQQAGESNWGVPFRLEGILTGIAAAASTVFGGAGEPSSPGHDSFGYSGCEGLFVEDDS